jgi:acetyl-CoA decarbonylase/synthase complex subunit delta
LAFQFYKESYAGAVKAITMGKGGKTVTVGGQTCYPFYQFEGEMPNKPKIAMEVWDMKPEDWAETAVKAFEDVIGDPAAWAKKCVKEHGADMIALLLRSTDPNDKDAGPDAAAATVKKVLDAIDVPLIVWGTANFKKDEAVLKKVAEVCQGRSLIIGPVEDKNHKGIGAAAMGFGHYVISSSPIDVNIAKQINILLENLGMPMNRVIVDPTTGGLGYGMEYSYSVMERLRMAAMAQGDEKLQYPVVNNVGFEVWKSKEAKLKADEAPILGDPEKRGILMESVAAVSYLMAGSDLLILRHPETVRLVRSFIALAADGGSAKNVAAVTKKMPAPKTDYAALAPAPNLTIEEEKKAAPAAAKPAAPAAAKPAAPAAAKPAAPAAKPAAPEAAPAPAAKAEDNAAAKAKAEADARAKADAAAKAKAEADAKAKADAAAKAKAEADAKAKADAEAKAKAEADAKAKLSSEEDSIREAMAKARAEKKVAVHKEAKLEVKKAAVELSAEELQAIRLNTMVTFIEWANTRPESYRR